MGDPTDVVLAVDVGGTKLAVALVSASGAVRARRGTPTPKPSGPGAGEALWSVLTSLIEDLSAGPDTPPTEAGPQAGHRIVACGVGCGGPMTPGGDLVSPLHIPAWRSFPLQARLAASVGAPTWVDNDAKALALGEGWAGAAVGVPDYLAMVVSTGVGGGIVLNGTLLEGASGNAGHVGHVVVDPDGRPCACGGRGCLEAEASGPAIAAATGGPPAAAGVDVRRRTGMLVGRAVASVANLLDLQLAVVGGSVALGYGDVFLAAARAEAAQRARLPFSSGLRIVLPPRGPDAPLLGAAAVAWRGLAGASTAPAAPDR